jgi:phosphatidylglycerophosphate synthase
MNLPNALSMFRILLTPVFVTVLSQRAGAAVVFDCALILFAGRRD